MPIVHPSGLAIQHRVDNMSAAGKRFSIPYYCSLLYCELQF